MQVLVPTTPVHVKDHCAHCMKKTWWEIQLIKINFGEYAIDFFIYCTRCRALRDPDATVVGYVVRDYSIEKWNELIGENYVADN